MVLRKLLQHGVIKLLQMRSVSDSMNFAYHYFFRIPKCQESRVKRIETQSSNRMPANDDFGGFGFGNEFPDPGKISTTTTSTTTTTQQIYIRPTEPRYVRPVEIQTRGSRPEATYRPRNDYVEPQWIDDGSMVDPPIHHETTTAMERQIEITEPKLSVQRMINLNTVSSITTRSSTESSAIEVLERIEPNENEVSSQENESDKQPQNRQGQLSVQVPNSVQSLTCK